jgi:peroxidase
MRIFVSVVIALTVVGTATAAGSAVRELNGSGNNRVHADWGAAGTSYLRVARANYADGVGKPVSGPPARYISNRIFNDVSQNLFSENNVTQWGFVWGQFMDHVFGLRREGTEPANIAYNANDRLESFENDLGVIPFARSAAAEGTGVSSPREQINIVSGYIDASNVYGDDAARLEWLRLGPLDGRLSNNSASLWLPNGFLPRANGRGNANAAPEMARDSRLLLTGGFEKAMVAGDRRANENIALTATHTLFAREHNRIVRSLPFWLPPDLKFEIARRVVGAEMQYITYEEFLPALGVRLAPYRGYNEAVNGGLSNEFAVVGYRAHSMIHGELEPAAPAGTWSTAQLDRFDAAGIEVVQEPGETVLVIPLNVAFFNPDLLEAVGLAPVLQGIGSEPQYKNDEMIDNQLRSVLFGIPKDPANAARCLDGPTLPDCFSGVVDLAAIDIERGRDHGMPSYNALRRAFGLSRKATFTEITGERTERFPDDPLISRTNPLNDPNILDFLKLFDINGAEIDMTDKAAVDSEAVTGVRRTTTAARLRAIYRGDVDSIDAFVGMSAERHVPGTEFGELQLAMWRKQFEALRDGDRFFYLNDPELVAIQQLFRISYRHTLAQVIEANTNAEVAANVFKAAG